MLQLSFVLSQKNNSKEILRFLQDNVNIYFLQIYKPYLRFCFTHWHTTVLNTASKLTS